MDEYSQNANLQKQLLIEQRIANNGKSTPPAYILWWLMGLFGGHRFYLGRKGTAIFMLLLTISAIGIPVSFIWWLIDAILIPGAVLKYNDNLRQKLTLQMS